MARTKYGFIGRIRGQQSSVAQFTLTAAQLATLDSAPVSLLAAPGANKAIVVTMCLFQFKYGSVQFTAGGAVNPVYHGATTALTASVAATTINAAANATIFVDAVAGPLAVATNTGIDLYAATQDFASGGNSTAVVTLWYEVITLG